jgi:hypothetical protein
VGQRRGTVAKGQFVAAKGRGEIAMVSAFLSRTALVRAIRHKALKHRIEEIWSDSARRPKGRGPERDFGPIERCVKSTRLDQMRQAPTENPRLKQRSEPQVLL